MPAEPDAETPASSPAVPPGRLWRPKPWLWAVAGLLVVASLFVLLSPVTVVYQLDSHGNPANLQVLSETRSDQVLDIPSDWDAPDGTPVTYVTSVRLGCGTAFTSGENEAKEPGGVPACSSGERPRTIVGWILAGLGLLGFAAGFVPRLLSRRS